jgi:WD40 repeat protein
MRMAARSESCLLTDDNRFAVAGDDRGTIWIWELSSGNLYASWSAHQTIVRDLVFDARDNILISTSDDGEAAIWVFGSGKLVSRVYDFADNWAIISGDLHYKGTAAFETFFSIVQGTNILDPSKFITQIGQQDVLDSIASPN